VISTWPVFSDYGGQGAAQQKQLRDLVMSQPAHGMALTARHALATRKPVYALEPGMRKLRIPTLVAYGTRDEACVQSSEFMAATIPGAQIWRVPNATHFINLDEPDLFDQKILDFLAT
jgi:pimeloyl-ACP methyl ester carboxylesterase